MSIWLTVFVFSWAFVKFCVCPLSLSVLYTSGVTVLIPDHCLSIYFDLFSILNYKTEQKRKHNRQLNIML